MDQQFIGEVSVMVSDLQAPLVCPREVVREDWIDYNGHLNMAYYNVIFDQQATKRNPGMPTQIFQS